MIKFQNLLHAFALGSKIMRVCIYETRKKVIQFLFQGTKDFDTIMQYKLFVHRANTI